MSNAATLSAASAHLQSRSAFGGGGVGVDLPGRTTLVGKEYVVDDGSSDDTEERLRLMARPNRGIRVLSRTRGA